MNKVKIGSKFKLKDQFGNESNYTVTSKRGADNYNKHQPKTQEDMDRISQPKTDRKFRF